MNEEKNIPSEEIPQELPAGEAGLSVADAEQQLTTNTKLQTENMETHAQELHKAPGHGWKHYFFEFFMLFLAVFCGFLAENWREHIVEQEREKQYMESLVADLKSDQEVLSKHIADVKAGTLMMDSLITILSNPSQVVDNTGRLYYLARLAPRLKPLSTNSRTFEQLKNSGNFRIIKKLGTSNKIMTYYEKFPLVHLLESINETEFTEYKKIASKIFDPAVMVKMEGINSVIKRIAENPPLRTADNELLQELSVFSVYMHGTKTGITGAAEELKVAGAELLEYLQKEYHLE